MAFTPSSNSWSRRRFLTVLGALPLASASASLLRADMMAAEKSGVAVAAKRSLPIGLELYSVRDGLSHDLPGTLTQIAKIGYEYVEFYAPYFDWTPAYAREVRSRMNDLGLRCHSTHNHIESFADGHDGLAKSIELNHTLGAKQLILATAPKGTNTADAWRKLSASLTEVVGKLQKEALTSGFHNHQTEWKPLEGDQRAMDILAKNTPPEFVLQLDVGTCIEAGVDPVAWINANPGRIRSVHLKDWAPGDEKAEKGYRVLFGEGVAPWVDIIQAASTTGGAELFLMEQEGSRYSEFQTAQVCLDNWKRISKQA